MKINPTSLKSDQSAQTRTPQHEACLKGFQLDRDRQRSEPSLLHVLPPIQRKQSAQSSKSGIKSVLSTQNHSPLRNLRWQDGPQRQQAILLFLENLAAVLSPRTTTTPQENTSTNRIICQSLLSSFTTLHQSFTKVYYRAGAHTRIRAYI